jgi:hypothetical protein
MKEMPSRDDPPGAYKRAVLWYYRNNRGDGDGGAVTPGKTVVALLNGYIKITI